MVLSTTILPVNWVGYIAFTYDSIYVAELKITQLDDQIGGVLEFTSGRHKGKRYRMQGMIQSNILTFCYYAEDKAANSQGTATFMLDENNYLGGLFAFYSEQSDSIDKAEGKFLPVSMATSKAEPFRIALPNKKKEFVKYDSMCEFSHW